jgi:GNAT superfamily N-acetyltransferase
VAALAELAPAVAARLRDWFLPDRPGPLVGLHVLHTGHGRVLADRPDAPRAVLVGTAGNWSLAGDPAALTPELLRPALRGFAEVPAAFVPLVEAAFPAAARWDRVVQVQRAARQAPARDVRRLGPADAPLLRALPGDLAWIAGTWGGPDGLAASGTAWGAVGGGRLGAVACPFFAGDRYEDIGVVTLPARRGQGLGTACAGAVCADVRARGRVPSWTTSADNPGSLGIAAALGFTLERRDVLHVIGVPIPSID